MPPAQAILAPKRSNYLKRTFRAIPGLVAWWTMQNRSFMPDGSGNGRSLTLHGAPTFGKTPTRGLYTNKVAADYWDAVDAPWNSITGGTFLAGWVKFANSASAIELIAGKWTSTGNQRCWNLERDVSGKLVFSISPDGTLTGVLSGVSTGVIATAWTFVAGRFIPSTSVNVWINNSTDAFVTSIPAAMIDGTGALELGSYNGGTTGMAGLIGSLALYNLAPSDAQVTALYNATKLLYSP